MRIPVLSADFRTAGYQDRLPAFYDDCLRRFPVFANGTGNFYLARHADCLALLTDESFTRQKPGPGSPGAGAASGLEQMIADWLLLSDPPRHTSLKSTMTEAFKHASPADLAQWMRSTCRQLTASLAGMDEFDVIDRLAFPLPAMVIARILGVPETDLPLLRGWASRLTAALHAFEPADINAGAAVAAEMRAYFSTAINGKTEGTGMVGGLHAACAHGRLSPDELLNNCAFMAWAGHETTRLLISSVVWSLNNHPGTWGELREDPGLIASAVEETLRCESPVQKVSRWLNRDMTFSGCEIPAGTLVTALIGAANRDPEVFADPARFNIRRSPNPHLAFGRGNHMCMGAALARLETRIAVESLVEGFEGLKTVRFQWQSYSSFRALEYLQVAPLP